MRHDGSQVACAKESALCDDPLLQSIGIRRWKLQKALSDASADQGILIQFGKRLKQATTLPDQSVRLEFEDGDIVMADLVFGADGVKSRVRASMFGETEVDYTGVTCLMGAAPLPRPIRGICFPSSSTTKCHACYYPTGDSETVFQIFFPTEERPETWGPLSEKDAVKECNELVERLRYVDGMIKYIQDIFRADGWSEDFLKPIILAQSVIRVGLRAREPLPVWVKDRCVLLGDAAHPPVPYIGQGAMMAIEDAGILALLISKFCLDSNNRYAFACIIFISILIKL